MEKWIKELSSEMMSRESSTLLSAMKEDSKLDRQLSKVETLSEIEKEDILYRKRKARAGLKHPMSLGFAGVPTIDSCRIETREYNQRLRESGLERKLLPKVRFQQKSTKSMNRYITWQVLRADKARRNPQLFWVIALQAIKRSVSFRTAAFNKVCHNWWHLYSIKDVIARLRKVNSILKKDSTNLKFMRYYLEKGDTFRPLGIPSVEWRTVCHMYSKWITLFLKEELKFNEAYQPKKGTLTAWTKIIRAVRKTNYIYEFDLKQFFPSVDVREVSDQLEKFHIPSKIVRWLEEVNRQQPDLPKNQKLDESEVLRKKQIHQDFEDGWKKGISNWDSPLFDGIRHLSRKEIEEGMSNLGCESVYEWVQMLWAIGDPLSKPIEKAIESIHKSLPQGLNTSPILSIISLVEWSKQLASAGIKLIMYADDGLLYSEKEFTPFSPKGIEFSESKSGWVKQESMWLKDLKFLGMTYDWRKKEIYGTSRRNRELRFEAGHDRIFSLLKELRPIYEWDRMDHLANSSLLGFVQAKMYQGDWDSIDWAEKETKSNANSWLNLVHWSTENKVLASSNACEWLSGWIKYHLKPKPKRNKLTSRKDPQMNKWKVAPTGEALKNIRLLAVSKYFQ